MENHHCLWENPLFLWPFSIAMLVYQRVPPKSRSFLGTPMVRSAHCWMPRYHVLGQLSQGCDDRPGVLAGQLWNWNCLGDPKWSKHQAIYPQKWGVEQQNSKVWRTSGDFTLKRLRILGAQRSLFAKSGRISTSSEFGFFVGPGYVLCGNFQEGIQGWITHPCSIIPTFLRLMVIDGAGSPPKVVLICWVEKEPFSKWMLNGIWIMNHLFGWK